jgi:cis-3-alkyl-4-acyloxetan-2-one decarboxylase
VSELYPFHGRYLDRPGGRLHFLDEGSGPPVVMLHGNPTWSFYYRNLVTALRPEYRCIVPDHLGCGRSDKPTPDQYDFSLKSRIDDLEALLDSLALTQNITLVVHDWGGMIGLGYAARHPDRIGRIIALNTGCGHLPKSKGFPWSLWLGRNTALGKWLILHRNTFCEKAADWCVTRNPLAPEVRAGLLEPYDTPAHRYAVWKFVQTIPLKPSEPGHDIVTHVEATLSKFSSVPTLLLWGLKDFVFDKHFLADWQRHFPHAETRTWPDCGHYILEDATAEVIAEIQSFLAKHPM